MAIRLDISDAVVTGHCSLCQWWEMRDTARAVLEAGAAHERKAHPGVRTTYYRLQKATRRGGKIFYS